MLKLKFNLGLLLSHQFPYSTTRRVNREPGSPLNSPLVRPISYQADDNLALD